MTECWICGRGMVKSHPVLPHPICKRARCLPERRFMLSAVAAEHQEHEYAAMEGWS